MLKTIMMLKLKIISLGLLLAVLCSFSFNTNKSYAKPDDNKEVVEKRIRQLETLEAEIQTELSGLNISLLKTSDALSKAQEKLDDLQEDINQKKENIDGLEEKIAKQQSDMEIRIQYMYENSRNQTLSAYLLKCKSITDLLNRQEYVGAVMDYDRKRLDEFEATLLRREEEQAELEEMYVELEREKEALKSDKDRLLSDIESSQQRLNDTREEKDEAKDELNRLISKMLKFEQMYVVQNGRELSKEEIYARQAESEGTSGRPVHPASGEEALLAAIIFCESGGESYTSQLAVGSVVLNRVNSSWFPNSITEVIYSHRQFSPVASGRLAVVLDRGLTTDSCRQAAHQVLNDGVTGSWLYFRLNDGSRSGTVIGKQVFY